MKLSIAMRIHIKQRSKSQETQTIYQYVYVLCVYVVRFCKARPIKMHDVSGKCTSCECGMYLCICVYE